MQSVLLGLILFGCCNQSDAFSVRQVGSVPPCQTIRQTPVLYNRRPMAMMSTDDSNSNSSNDEEDDTPSVGFGVGEKTVGMKNLIQNEEDDTLMHEKSAKSKPNNKSSPTLSPKAVLKFIAPTLALWIAPPIMSLIDTSVVGRFCGSNDLAALSPGCTLIDSSSYLFFFIATATTNLVASAIANGDDDSAADRIVSEALFLALCSGIFLGGSVLVSGGPLLALIAGKASVSVVPSALKYALVRAFGQPFVILASVARAAALAEKDTRGPLISVAIAFALNMIGTLTLVRKFSMGIAGAAIGTLCADMASTMYLLDRIKRSRKRRAKDSGKAATPLLVIPSNDSFQRFVRYAAPIFFTILGKAVVYNGIAMSVGRLGSVALAAHQVLLRSFFFWCPVGDSVGMTSQVFLPGILAEEKRTGVQKNGAKRLLFTTGVVAGLVAAALAGLLPAKGAALFTRDAQVAAALIRTAPILGISISMHAIALTCEGMLLAQRDLGFLSNSYIVTTIATIGLLLSPFRPATLGGSWWVLAAFQGSRSIQFALRNLFLSRMNKVKEA